MVSKQAEEVTELSEFCSFAGFGEDMPEKDQGISTNVVLMGRSDVADGRFGDRLLRIPEVAELMGLATGSVYHLVSQKRIPVVRLSARCVRVRLSALLSLWEELTDQKNEPR